MARVLVTGGAGFIGSHLVESLLRRGHEVLSLDNYFTGSKDNLRHLQDNPRLELIRHDVVNPIMLEVDQIYHLACPASPVHYQYNPVKTIKTNVIGTLNMLGLAKRLKARILLASTSEVYGDPAVHPQKEEYWGNVNCIGPRSCYDEGKRVAETLMMDYHRQNGVDIRIARIFNTFGPRMAINDGRVISNFIVQALTGKEITIYGEGQQTRSFCYVSDLVEGLVRLMESERFSGPVNLGNPEETTILEAAHLILALTGSPAALAYRPLPPDDPTRRRPDITRAGELLKWRPTVPLETGLKETIPYFVRKLKQENYPVAVSPSF
jgi:UDP-glucuronate decarboxylase